MQKSDLMADLDRQMAAMQEGYEAGHARALHQAAELVRSMRGGWLGHFINAYTAARLIRYIKPNDPTS
jgi:hypothetical protein